MRIKSRKRLLLSQNANAKMRTVCQRGRSNEMDAAVINYPSAFFFSLAKTAENNCE
jgi:hypothetical protein